MTQMIFVLLGALGGGFLATLAKEMFNRKKTNAEAERSEAEAAEILTRIATEMVREQVQIANRLSDRVKHLEETIDLLRLDVMALTNQLREAGLEPKLPSGGRYG